MLVDGSCGTYKKDNVNLKELLQNDGMVYSSNWHEDNQSELTGDETGRKNADSGRQLSPLRPPRRKRPEHVPGTSLSVIDPAIGEVMLVDTGQHVPVSEVLGTDFAELMKLRMSVRTALHQDRPLYRCSICSVPVYICRTKNEQRFFFKHRHETGNCPAITRDGLNQKELDARKYNGAKESTLHLTMKNWLVECLTADGRFEEIRQESRWTGPLTGEWRRPDVSATFNGIPIAFEVQLSTTYLNVIAERRSFYLEQGGLLFWIFAVFDSEHRRMTEDDVFYNNNQNAFIVNMQTREDSLSSGEFKLDCVWAEPTKQGGTSAFHRKRVSFHDLVLDPGTQRAYFYDFDSAKQKLIEASNQAAQVLRDDFEAWCGERGYLSKSRDAEWEVFKRRFYPYGFQFPRYRSAMDFGLFLALYSAKNNRPWGSGRHRLVEVAHRVATAEKRHLTWFMHAVRKYGHLATMEAEGNPKKWKDKYEGCRDEYYDNRDLYEPPLDKLSLVEFLFPELCPLPLPKDPT